MKKLLLVLLGGILISSCTQNQRAKSFGGTAEVNLPEGRKLVNATWKGEQIWYLTETMPEGYEPKDYEFQEESSFGMIEGKIIFKESK